MEDALKTKARRCLPHQEAGSRDRGSADQADERARNTGGAWKSWRALRNFRICCTANSRRALRSGWSRLSRRGFLQLMGASLAMAGMTGCTKLPLEPIVPYVRQPEDIIPGRPNVLRDGGNTEWICESRC